MRGITLLAVEHLRSSTRLLRSAKSEAKGISSFQKIVTDGINKNLLKWKWIEATKELALSGNLKVVIVGAGKEDLPIIVGGDTSPGSSERPPSPGAR